MPTYKQRVRFTLEFSTQAEDAAEATARLEEAIDDVEIQADVRSEGFHPFEDEDVPCPKCRGGEDTKEERCSLCNGDGEVSFKAAKSFSRL